MHPYDLAGEAEADAASRCFGREERDEDVVLQVGRNARPVVRYPYFQLLLLLFYLYADVSVFLSFEGFHGVLQQVGQDLRKLFFIRINRYFRLEKVEGEAELLPLHIRLVQGLQVLEQTGEGERFGFRLLQVGELPVRLGEMYQAFPPWLLIVSSPRTVLRTVVSVISSLLLTDSFVRK